MESNSDDITLFNVVSQPSDTISRYFRPESLIDGRYEIIKEIAHGGMGFVFEAFDCKLKRAVAVKVLYCQNNIGVNIFSAMMEQFQKEAEVCASLNHPNIVQIYDYGTYMQIPFIVMEYIKGVPISQYIEEKKPEGYTLQAKLICDIAKSLEYLHKFNIIHRDIKPSNILVTEEEIPKLIDFGIVKTTNAESNLTRNVGLMGTDAYMSPEQIKMSGMDQQSDIYSLGVVLYEITTSKKMYEGSAYQIFQHIVDGIFIPPREVKNDIPQALEKIILTATNTNKEKRYKTGQKFADDLEKFLSKGNSFSPFNKKVSKVATQSKTSSFTKMHKKAYLSKEKNETSQIENDSIEKNLTKTTTRHTKYYKQMPKKSNIYGIVITSLVVVLFLVLLLLNGTKKAESKPIQPQKEVSLQQKNKQLEQKPQLPTQQENNRPWKNKQDTQQENNRPWKNKQDTQQENNRPWKNKQDTQQENNRPWKNKQDTQQENNRPWKNKQDTQQEQPQKTQQDTHYLEEYAKSITPKNFEYLGIQHYTCEKLSNDIAIYKHVPSNMRFSLILGGDFTMGDGKWNNPPQKKHVDDFLMAQVPCTQEQWEIIMNEKPWSNVKLRAERGYLVNDYSKWSFISTRLGQIRNQDKKLESFVDNNQWNKIYSIQDRIYKQKAAMAFRELMKLCDPEVENELIEKHAKGAMRNEKFFPATCITPEDCENFCKKTGFSLPTEAQWEYACRAGSQDNYCFGNNIALLPKYSWSGTGELHKVMRKAPNAFGLYEMHGSICEYTLGVYDEGRIEIPYYKDEASFQKDMQSGNYFQNASIRKYKKHSARGGMSSWGKDRCTSAFRTWNWIPDYCYGVRFCVNLKK